MKSDRSVLGSGRTPHETAGPRRRVRRAGLRRGAALLVALGITAACPCALAQGKADDKKADKVDDKKVDDKKADDKKADDKKADDKKADGASASGGVTAGAVPTYGKRETASATDVAEDPLKRYMFIGARYRGSVVPKFAQNLFVDEGGTVYTNTVGVEFDLRKDGFSFVPALSFQELGTEDLLFHQKGQPTDIAGNYSVVNSSMKTVFASVDLLWSAQLHKNVDFEFGGGFGVGVIFGDLAINWVYEDQNGPYAADTGKHYSPCPGPTGQETANLKGCNKADHRGATDVRTGGFTEPSWFNGGSKPPLYLWATPQIGLRIKPVKQFQARLGLGCSLLTGPWFGLSGYFGLERTEKAP